MKSWKPKKSTKFGKTETSNAEKISRIKIANIMFLKITIEMKASVECECKCKCVCTVCSFCVCVILFLLLSAVLLSVACWVCFCFCCWRTYANTNEFLENSQKWEVRTNSRLAPCEKLVVHLTSYSLFMGETWTSGRHTMFRKLWKVMTERWETRRRWVGMIPSRGQHGVSDRNLTQIWLNNQWASTHCGAIEACTWMARPSTNQVKRSLP